MAIDAHHHLWEYHPQEFPWITDEMDVLRRDFLPGDLESSVSETEVEGTVAVQARQTEAETRWLLDLANSHEIIKGVVGWVPLTDRSLEKVLERYAHNPYLKGVRHVLHDEPDDKYMLRDDFNRGIALLRSFDLVYEILIFEKHLPQTIAFVDRHPDQVFVVDHIAKPNIASGELHPWEENLRELARRERVYCKMSGLVTEAHWNRWTPKQFRPYVETAMEAFGPHRVMFGSDWPVCTVACAYGDWYRTVGDFLADYSASERKWVLAETAREVYRLPE